MKKKNCNILLTVITALFCLVLSAMIWMIVKYTEYAGTVAVAIPAALRRVITRFGL